MKRIAIFSGSSHRALSTAIVNASEGRLRLSTSTVKRFSDGETFVRIEENVRGADTYVVQSTCGPANDNVMELLITIDALRRASAGTITAVVPYYGYARQDRKVEPRTPITASLVTSLIMGAGADRIVSVDLHSSQIQGFTQKPFDNLYARPALIRYLSSRFSDATFVSPDAGGVERARGYAKRMNKALAIIDKRRERANESEVMNIIGEVEGKDCVILDDIIDTAGTLVNAANALVKAGAKSVAACATHPVLSGPAVTRIKESALTEVIVSDTVPLSEEANASGRFKVVSVAGLLAEAIVRIHHDDSVSSLFNDT